MLEEFQSIVDETINSFVFETPNDQTYLALNKAITDKLYATQKVRYAYTTFNQQPEASQISGHVFILPNLENGRQPPHRTINFKIPLTGTELENANN